MTLENEIFKKKNKKEVSDDTAVVDASTINGSGLGLLSLGDTSPPSSPTTAALFQTAPESPACSLPQDNESPFLSKRDRINKIERDRKKKMNHLILSLGNMVPNFEPSKKGAFQSKICILETVYSYFHDLSEKYYKVLEDKLSAVQAAELSDLRQKVESLTRKNTEMEELLRDTMNESRSGKKPWVKRRMNETSDSHDSDASEEPKQLPPPPASTQPSILPMPTPIVPAPAAPVTPAKPSVPLNGIASIPNIEQGGFILSQTGTILYIPPGSVMRPEQPSPKEPEPEPESSQSMGLITGNVVQTNGKTAFMLPNGQMIPVMSEPQTVSTPINGPLLVPANVKPPVVAPKPPGDRSTKHRAIRPKPPTNHSAMSMMAPPLVLSDLLTINTSLAPPAQEQEPKNDGDILSRAAESIFSSFHSPKMEEPKVEEMLALAAKEEEKPPEEAPKRVEEEPIRIEPEQVRIVPEQMRIVPEQKRVEPEQKRIEAVMPKEFESDAGKGSKGKRKKATKASPTKVSSEEPSVPTVESILPEATTLEAIARIEMSPPTEPIQTVEPAPLEPAKTEKNEAEKKAQPKKGGRKSRKKEPALKPDAKEEPPKQDSLPKPESPEKKKVDVKEEVVAPLELEAPVDPKKKKKASNSTQASPPKKGRKAKQGASPESSSPPKASLKLKISVAQQKSNFIAEGEEVEIRSSKPKKKPPAKKKGTICFDESEIESILDQVENMPPPKTAKRNTRKRKADETSEELALDAKKAKPDDKKVEEDEDEADDELKIVETSLPTDKSQELSASSGRDLFATPSAERDPLVVNENAIPQETSTPNASFLCERDKLPPMETDKGLPPADSLADTLDASAVLVETSNAHSLTADGEANLELLSTMADLASPVLDKKDAPAPIMIPEVPKKVPNYFDTINSPSHQVKPMESSGYFGAFKHTSSCSYEKAASSFSPEPNGFFVESMSKPTTQNPSEPRAVPDSVDSLIPGFEARPSSLVADLQQDLRPPSSHHYPYSVASITADKAKLKTKEAAAPKPKAPPVAKPQNKRAPLPTYFDPYAHSMFPHSFSEPQPYFAPFQSFDSQNAQKTAPSTFNPWRQHTPYPSYAPHQPFHLGPLFGEGEQAHSMPPMHHRQERHHQQNSFMHPMTLLHHNPHQAGFDPVRPTTTHAGSMQSFGPMQSFGLPPINFNH